MDVGRNRPGRKDHSRLARLSRSLSRRLRGLLPALAISSTLALGAAPAQAMTGGASAFAPPATTADGGLVFTSLRTAGATWYGPGLYGNNTACGQTLRPQTIGVAHRSLPCGTAVKFLYRGRSLVARVIDRGPYSAGNDWDLTNGARLVLGFEGANLVRYAIARRAAR
jgi:rare lipoprotein A